MKHNLRPLSDQVMVTTGASSTIGLVTARQAAGRGAAAVVVVARNAEVLETLAQEIRDGGGRALAVPTNESSDENVRRLADAAVATFGRIDTWANNVSVSVFGMADEGRCSS